MHIKYIDGLKGLCAILVVFLHYLMGYVGRGFVGWQSGIEDAQKLDYFWANFPLSGVINATFILQIFFTIVAFLPAWHFFNKQDTEWIKRQAIIRYFRFVPYIFVIVILSYIIYLSGGYFNQEVSRLLDIQWTGALLVGNFSWPDAIEAGLFRAFVYGDGGYVSVLWCMHIIFIGSYIAYACILLFASAKRHMCIYAVLFLLCAVVLPWTMPFVGGVMVASIANAEFKNPSGDTFRKVVGFSLFFVGMALGMCVDGLTMNYILQDIIKNCAAICVTLSVFYLDFLQRFLQTPFLISCGKYGFSILVIHCLVMLSISAWLFLKLHAWLGYDLALWISFILSIIPLTLATVIFAKIMDPICIKLSRKIYNLLS